jgi:hypothetical protein
LPGSRGGLASAVQRERRTSRRLHRYGAHFGIGSAPARGYGDFLDAAVAKINCNTSAAALTSLEAAIRSGRAVQAHLDRADAGPGVRACQTITD